MSIQWGIPLLVRNGEWMYFASDMPGGFGGVDLYKIEMRSDGTFGEPELILEKRLIPRATKCSRYPP